MTAYCPKCGGDVFIYVEEKKPLMWFRCLISAFRGALEVECEDCNYSTEVFNWNGEFED